MVVTHSLEAVRGWKGGGGHSFAVRQSGGMVSMLLANSMLLLEILLNAVLS